jgi:hypothetical protein
MMTPGYCVFPIKIKLNNLIFKINVLMYSVAAQGIAQLLNNPNN